MTQVDERSRLKFVKIALDIRACFENLSQIIADDICDLTKDDI